MSQKIRILALNGTYINVCVQIENISTVRTTLKRSQVVRVVVVNCESWLKAPCNNPIRHTTQYNPGLESWNLSTVFGFYQSRRFQALVSMLKKLYSRAPSPTKTMVFQGGENWRFIQFISTRSVFFYVIKSIRFKKYSFTFDFKPIYTIDRTTFLRIKFFAFSARIYQTR